MSDDEADLELLALLRQHLGLGPPDASLPPETKVLRDAQFICDNSIDVAVDMQGTFSTAERIWKCMQKRHYNTQSWYNHELHPDTRDEAALEFIFTMDLLNFSFWSEKKLDERYAVHYQNKNWTGYWSLVASLRRALDEG
jgi:Potential Queuosine, Q, salvage protein family